MKGSQAVNCVKAFGNHRRPVTFERLNGSAGYTVRVEGVTYESDRKMVRDVANKLSLKVKEEENSIIIL